PGQPWQRLVRCMPNTPALVGAGMTGLAALPGVTPQDRELVFIEALIAGGRAVGLTDEQARQLALGTLA
ncbi:pyrroline-5-carboxylate reductase family protein, partial [Bordetella pertussis]|uniref:pyrroline-5-carboxylate reductase family protein n=1 Tax=Bordetella pertussis TaxID=520 RepID=UPI00387A2BCE